MPIIQLYIDASCKYIYPGHHNCDLVQYADVFMTNNINGKRLLLLNQASLQAMGIASLGHRIDLHVSVFVTG